MSSSYEWPANNPAIFATTERLTEYVISAHTFSDRGGEADGRRLTRSLTFHSSVKALELCGFHSVHASAC